MGRTIVTALPAALSVALVAGALAVPAIATTDDDADGGTSVEEVAPLRDRAMLRTEDGLFVERLAAELGLEVEELQAAIDAVREDLELTRVEHLRARLTERVEAGDLTQEEADAMVEAAEDGDWPPQRGDRARRSGRGHGAPGPWLGVPGSNG